MNRSFAMRLGQRVRAARHRAGLSVSQLASRVGTSKSHLYQIERGARAPRAQTLERIEAATGEVLL